MSPEQSQPPSTSGGAAGTAGCVDGRDRAAVGLFGTEHADSPFQEVVRAISAGLPARVECHPHATAVVRHGTGRRGTRPSHSLLPFGAVVQSGVTRGGVGKGGGSG